MKCRLASANKARHQVGAPVNVLDFSQLGLFVRKLSKTTKPPAAYRSPILQHSLASNSLSSESLHLIHQASLCFSIRRECTGYQIPVATDVSQTHI